MAWHLQAGSCPTVGISGHILGGRQGLLARSHGLTCDSLLELTLVDSQLRILTVNERSEPYLYWACKGGGGGSFGIATQFRLHLFPLKSALVFGVTWKLSAVCGGKTLRGLAGLGAERAHNITSIMKVQSAGGGKITLRCIGQSVSSEAELRTQLQALVAMDKPSSACRSSRSASSMR